MQISQVEDLRQTVFGPVLHLALARVGNAFVNRNMIGAVVAGTALWRRGLSGSERKASGPHWLYRFCAEPTLTINSAAAGANAELLAGNSAQAEVLYAVRGVEAAQCGRY